MATQDVILWNHAFASALLTCDTILCTLSRKSAALENVLSKGMASGCEHESSLLLAAVPQDEAEEKAQHSGKYESGPIVRNIPGIALPEPVKHSRRP